MRKLIPVFAFLCVTGLATAQTVTVPTDFATIQSAINSFTLGGSNYGQPAANLIQVDATAGPYNEALYIWDRPTTPVEDLTLRGINGRAVAQVRANGVAAGGDGFYINANGQFDIENLAFVPSTTTPFTDDMFFVDLPAAGDLVLNFRSCVLTSANAAGLPVVTSYTDAASSHTASIVTPIPDDALTIAPGVGEFTTLNFEDCIISHIGGTGNKDGIVDVGRRAATGQPYAIRLYRSIISYCPRYGYQAAGFGQAGDPTAFRIVFEGDATTPTLITNNLRGIQSFFGPDRGLIDLNRAYVVNSTERAVSLGATLAVENATDAIFANTGIAFVFGHDDTWTTSTFTRCTLHNVGTGFLVDIGGTTPNHGSVILRNTIVSDSNANDVLIGPFGTGPNGTWTVDVDFSALVTSGNEAIGGLGATGFEAVGSNIVSGSPIYIQTTNPLGTDYFDVQSGAYATAGPAGAALEGGGDYVGGVPTAVRDWTLF